MDKDFIAAALDYHRSPTRGKIAVVPTKADQPARSGAGVFTRCGCRLRCHRGRPADAQE